MIPPIKSLYYVEPASLSRGDDLVPIIPNRIFYRSGKFVGSINGDIYRLLDWYDPIVLNDIRWLIRFVKTAADQMASVSIYEVDFRGLDIRPDYISIAEKMDCVPRKEGEEWSFEFLTVPLALEGILDRRKKLLLSEITPELSVALVGSVCCISDIDPERLTIVKKMGFADFEKSFVSKIRGG